MRILQVNHGYPPDGVGGTECYVAALCRELSSRPHDVHAFVGSTEVRDACGLETGRPDPQGHPVEVTRVHRGDLYFDRWDKAYHPGVSALFREHLRAHRPDVVHVHQWIRLTSDLCALATAAGIPVVVTLHDFHTTCPRLFRTRRDLALCDAAVGLEPCGSCAERWPFQDDREIEAALRAYVEAFQHELRCARRVLAPSRTHAAALARHLDGDRAIDVLPLGRHAEPGKAPRPRGDRLQIVSFGQLFPHKGAHLLVEAFRGVPAGRAELHLFGGEPDPAYAAGLRALAAGLPVTFHGAYRVEELSAVPMDLVVLPTLVPETWSFVLDEAACLGVPVLAADAGAIPERATPAVRLFGRGDVAALRRALAELVAAPEQLDAMRRAAPVRTMPMPEHAAALEAIYREAVAAGPGQVVDGWSPGHDQAMWTAREETLRRLASGNTPGRGTRST